LGIGACFGTLDTTLCQDLQDAGASMCTLKCECADRAHYAEFQAPGTLAERLRHVRLLAANGWSVSSGFIAGLPGQKPEDLVNNLRLARKLPVRGCSVSPFIPGEATPLAGHPPASGDWTVHCMAALRLMKPDWVIPAVSALNLTEPDGYRRGLRAGANLVTINLTPTRARGDYVIYSRDRVIMTEARVLNAIPEEGLQVSKQGLAEFYRNGASQPTARDVECGY
jgi:biotin synthase